MSLAQAPFRRLPINGRQLDADQIKECLSALDDNQMVLHAQMIEIMARLDFLCDEAREQRSFRAKMYLGGASIIALLMGKLLGLGL